jgi:hypothetical protein
MNLPIYDVSLIVSCKPVAKLWKNFIVCVKTFLESSHIFNFWCDDSEYVRSVMLCGCLLTYHLIDYIILSFST